MIRTRKLIGKAQLFDYLGQPEISKIEINTCKQKTLKNKEICSIYIYHRINWADICSVIGRCEAAKLEDLGADESYKEFVTNFCSCKRDGFVTASNINKLVEIEKKNRVSFQHIKTN